MRQEIPGGEQVTRSAVPHASDTAPFSALTGAPTERSESKLQGVLAQERILYNMKPERYGELLGVSPNGMIAAFFRKDDGAGSLISERAPHLDLPGTHVGAVLKMASFLPGTVTLFSLAEGLGEADPKPLSSFRFNHKRQPGITTLTPLSDGERVLVSQSHGFGDLGIFRNTAYPLTFEVGRIGRGAEIQDLSIEREFKSHARSPKLVINPAETEVFLHGTGSATLFQSVVSRGSPQGTSLNIVERHSLVPGNPFSQILSDGISGLGRYEPAHSNAVAGSPAGEFALSGILGGVEYFKLTGKKPSRGALVGDIKLPGYAAVNLLAFDAAGERLALAYTLLDESPSVKHPIQIYQVDKSRAVPHFRFQREFDSIYLSDEGHLSFIPGGDGVVVGGYCKSIVTSIGHNDAATQLILGTCDYSSGRLNAEGNVVASRGDLIVFKSKLSRAA